MNVATTFPGGPRRAASPYARRLARERAVDLAGLSGSGPDGRIVAADVIAYRAPAPGSAPAPDAPAGRAVPTIAFSAPLSLANLFRLAEEATRVGLTIDLEDAALRAACAALSAVEPAKEPRVALEADGRQVLISTGTDLSIGAQRRLRLAALETGLDRSGDPSTASLLVLRAARAVPVSLPLLADRALRLVLVVDAAAATANLLLSAASDTFSEDRVVQLLESFVGALEDPLVLMA